MTRGNQRDLAREKNMKKQKEREKHARDDGLSPAQRKEIDAERMRKKQQEAELKRNGGEKAS